MTDAERAELKRLAEGATPGPWRAILTGDGTQGWIGHGVSGWLKQDYDGEFDVKDVLFIAAANPAAVLALLAENERLTHDRDAAESARAQQAERARRAEEAAAFNEARANERNDFAQRLNRSEAENARLLAEVEQLKDVISEYSTATWEREEAREVDT